MSYFENCEVEQPRIFNNNGLVLNNNKTYMLNFTRMIIRGEAVAKGQRAEAVAEYLSEK